MTEQVVTIKTPKVAFLTKRYLLNKLKPEIVIAMSDDVYFINANAKFLQEILIR